MNREYLRMRLSENSDRSLAGVKIGPEAPFSWAELRQVSCPCPPIQRFSPAERGFLRSWGLKRKRLNTRRVQEVGEPEVNLQAWKRNG